jgi:tRNA-splicing ligase RtcB (3'-phosphate/5'-hydroxy nucleic acid ligase)
MVEFKKINDMTWKIETEGTMNVPVTIYASENLLEKIKQDDTIKQAMNMASLPGVLGDVVVCPDAHQGYGACIGGVSAFDLEIGVVSPGEIGYDINCSVRLLKTNLKKEDLVGKEKEISNSLFRAIPSGVGRKGDILLNNKELDEVLINGAQWAVEKGYGVKNDWIHTEEEGRIFGANSSSVSQRAKGRGMHQLGSLGAGNHFIDILAVDEIFDKNIAKVFGLKEDQVVILIHCGSRGLGHQVASDYIKLMEDKYGYPSFDRSLVNAPIKSKLGKKYFEAMACAANFAFANKQIITHLIRKEMKKYFSNFKTDVVYDVCHNIAKFEKFNEKEVLVIRKGATRSFGPGRIEVPEDYRKIGQPVLIPGSMGTASYVLCGTKKAEEVSWGSTAHGAGRVRSRKEAHKKMSFENAKKDMEKRGIFVEFGGQKGLIEESPLSYKNIDEVVKVSDRAGLGKKVARLKPLIVIIG